MVLILALRLAQRLGLALDLRSGVGLGLVLEAMVGVLGLILELVEQPHLMLQGSGHHSGWMGKPDHRHSASGHRPQPRHHHLVMLTGHVGSGHERVGSTAKSRVARQRRLTGALHQVGVRG